MQKALEKLKENFQHLGKCLELSKDVLAECTDKLTELYSEMTDLESMIEEITPNNNKKYSDATESFHGGRSLSKKTSGQEIIEEITIEGGEKHSGSRSRLGSYEQRRKRQKTNQDDDAASFINQHRDEECTPGPSRETRSIKAQDEHTINEKDVMNISETYFAEEAVATAMRKTKGVLSAEEFNTFLSLSDRVQDPVQLAKVSFTKEIKQLYYQLTTFHFHLKVANDVVEKERGTTNTNRDLEDKVQILIHTFQAEV